MPEQLIPADDLARLLGDPDLRIADTRWYLAEPEGGRAAYDESHIPGAIFVDLDRDLSAAAGPGRHPLPPPAEFAATMGRLGIGDRHLVVAYDDRGGAVAARLWWMLREVGHHNVRVLDGGIQAWTTAGLPVTSEAAAFPPAELTVRPPLTRSIERESLRSRLGTVVLLDARAAERYRGDEEPVDPVAGHIPTARSAPYEGNLAADGRLLAAADLAARFRDLGAGGDRDVVVYCGSGVNACHHALAMAVAGLPEPILYGGSWSDWSTAGLPAATGDDPGHAPAGESALPPSGPGSQIVQVAEYEVTGDPDAFLEAIEAVAARVEAEGVETMRRYTFYLDREARTVVSVIVHDGPASWVRHHEMLDRWHDEFARLKQTVHQTRLRLMGPVSPEMRAWLDARGVRYEAEWRPAGGFLRAAPPE
jgi:thiosulfate/3-mercaptopyruvate sulfurtransferase